mmetsp:Transcript_6148/g.21615  ORF Transcript_6148/g.21615 Transcript_6148/m.21615 type:complete len:218 (-) Transcript_6148:1651-2304(-)
MSAWVPTTMSMSPALSLSSTRARCLRVELVSSSTLGLFSLSSRAISFSSSWKCCVATSSVGAMSAPCQPMPSFFPPVQSSPTTASRARKATIVLPHPTSPCSSRIIGAGPCRSPSTSRSTRSCAWVSSQSSLCLASSASAVPVTQHTSLPRARLRLYDRHRSITTCSRKFSSKTRRLLAFKRLCTLSGSCMFRRASARGTRPSDLRAVLSITWSSSR